MLEPHGRTLLFDVLKPPEGHSLDAAIATTFTLDLLALLTAPVAFSLFDVDNPKELLDRDSLTLLESLRRYADKITVFCHEGYIALPKVQFPQLEFLEKSIVQCRGRREGALFHPKVWLLRFAGEQGTVTYRLACLTRNLTFDRSWDTVLTLDGPLLDRQRAIAANNPLGDFVRALADQAPGPLSGVVRERIRVMESEVRRVEFQVPEGFESYEFHPFGIDGAKPFPFDKRPGRMLIVSPFISDGGLQRLTKDREASLLASRPESLEQPACRLGGFEKLYVLARETEQESDEPQEPLQVDLTRGLHAKCYVIDAGWKSHVFTGSANATGGAFNGNVEFLVELVGPKSKFGIDALFRSEEGRPSLGSLLEEFKPQPKPQDDEEEGIRAALERARQSIAQSGLSAIVEPVDAEYAVRLQATDGWRVDPNVKVWCWPISLGQGHARVLSPGDHTILFERLSFEALTAFFAFKVATGEPERSEVFVLNVPLQGAPEDRRERLLRLFIKDRQRLMRMLLLLLADDSELADAMGTKTRKGSEDVGTGDAAHANGALLESLLRTLHQSPERLDTVARLIEDVRTQPDSSELFPEAFDDIWQPIWAVRRGGQP